MGALLWATVATGAGPLAVGVGGGFVVQVGFADELRPGPPSAGAGSRADRGLLGDAARQLREYFAGRRRAFTLPLAPAPTPFQASVRQALLTVAYGQTISYGDLAARVGKPTAARAVGGANHNNPIGVIVPCHRVVGRDGTLTGYAGGLRRKAWLLALEASHR
jgi:methylated-DNA-[protein]-cysteine S-methyltransferase